MSLCTVSPSTNQMLPKQDKQKQDHLGNKCTVIEVVQQWAGSLSNAARGNKAL